MADDAKKVILYSTSWCAFCKTEKQYLERLGVEFEYKDIEADQDAYDELMSKSGGNFRGVPVTDIGGDLVLGFDRPKIDELLKTKNLLPAAN